MSKNLLSSATPLLLTILVLSACAHPAPTTPLRLELSAADRQAAEPPAPPPPIELRPPHDTGAAERAYLFEQVIAPLLTFSLAQEAARIAERSRADALVAKIDILAQLQARLDQQDLDGTAPIPRFGLELRMPWIEKQRQSGVTNEH